MPRLSNKAITAVALEEHLREGREPCSKVGYTSAEAKAALQGLRLRRHGKRFRTHLDRKAKPIHITVERIA